MSFTDGWQRGFKYDLCLFYYVFSSFASHRQCHIEQHLFYADQYDGSLYDVLCFAGYIRA